MLTGGRSRQRRPGRRASKTLQRLADDVRSAQGLDRNPASAGVGNPWIRSWLNMLVPMSTILLMGGLHSHHLGADRGRGHFNSAEGQAGLWTEGRREV